MKNLWYSNKFNIAKSVFNIFKNFFKLPKYMNNFFLSDMNCSSSDDQEVSIESRINDNLQFRTINH